MATVTQGEPVLGSFEQSDVHLRKSIGFTSILFMSIGAIIGSGWLLGSLNAASVAGPASILSWAIGGLFIIFIAMSYAELSGMLPRTGAIVRYPQLTHGSYTGWMIGWTYFLSAISVPAIEAEAVVTYVGGQFPGVGFVQKSGVLTGNGIGFAVGLMVLFFILNFFGVKLLGEWNKAFTWWKLLIPTATFCMLFVAFDGASFNSYKGGFFAEGTGNIFVAMSTTGVVFAYLGFRQALDYAGESRRPQRDVPLATILSVVITMIIYVALEVGLVGALNWGAAGVHPGNWAGLVGAGSKWTTAPLYDALRATGISALLTFAPFLLVDAGISPSGTGWIYMGTSARTNYGMSVNRYGPKALQWPNKWGIPWVSLILAFVIGCVFFIPAPSWYKLVGFITSTTALTYIMGGLGVPVFRRYAPQLHRPFRLPLSFFWAPVGFLAAAMLVFWSTFPTLASVYAAVFIGMPLFVWYYAIRKGWAKTVPAAVLGAAFLGGWVYLSLRSGWVLRSAKVLPVPGSWSFGTYDIALSAAIVFFVVGLWAICNKEGKKHVERTAWFIWMLLALFPLEYYTQTVGPLTSAPLKFQWGTLIAVGVGIVAYYWGVASGFMTDELQDIVDAAGGGAAKAVPAGAAGAGLGSSDRPVVSPTTTMGEAAPPETGPLPPSQPGGAP
ncbi:MAG: APC family permease [Acidimicrobiales bacterium]